MGNHYNRSIRMLLKYRPAGVILLVWLTCLLFSNTGFSQNGVDITSTESSPTSATPIPLTIQFDNPVNKEITATDFDITNGIIQNFNRDSIFFTKTREPIEIEDVPIKASLLEVGLQGGPAKFLSNKLRNSVIAITQYTDTDIYYLTYSAGVKSLNLISTSKQETDIEGSNLSSPLDIEADINEKRLFLADKDQQQVNYYDISASTKLGDFKVPNYDSSNDVGPTSVVTDESGNLYVAVAFTPSGTYDVEYDKIAKYENGDYINPVIFPDDNSEIELDRPYRIAVDKKGNIYVADSGGSTEYGRVVVFNKNYELIHIIEGLKDNIGAPGSIAIDDYGYVYIVDYQEDITFNGIFQNPIGLVTKFDKIKSTHYSINIYDSNSNFKYVTETTFNDSLNLPIDLEIDYCGNILVDDMNISGVLLGADGIDVNFNFQLKTFTRNDIFSAELVPASEGIVEVDLKDDVNFFKCGTQPQDHFEIVYEAANQNTAPEAQDDSYQTDQDQTLTKNASEGVLANDTDEDGDDLTAELGADVSNGTLNLNPDGSFTYTPDPGFTGPDDFTYMVNDGQETSNEVTVTITVNAVEPENTAPVAQEDSYQTDQDQSLTKNASEGVLANDTDEDGDDLTAELGTDVSNGTLTLNPDGSFEYTPDPGFTGPDDFTYLANDGQEDSNEVTVTITVNAVEPENTAPEAQDDSYQIDQDQILTKNASEGVLANDTDEDGDELTAELGTDVSNGTLTLNPDGSFEYTPDPGFTGPDDFTYVANDGQADSNEVTVTITVNSVEPENTAPVAVEDNYQVDEDDILTVSVEEGVLINDTDDDEDDLTAILVQDVTDGTLDLNQDGSFTYTPNDGNVGQDSFTYVANDGQEDSNEVTVIITVIPPGTGPQFQDCPADMEVDNDPGECGAVVNFETPTATDETGDVEVIQISGPASGSLFSVGETEVVFEATDDQGNKEYCRFTVTVNDDEDPVVVCQDKEVWLDENGKVSISASELDGGSYDNCGISEVRLSQTEFTTDDIGENQLTLSVTDLNENTKVCDVSLTVRAYDPDPEINCVENYGLQLDESGQVSLEISELYSGNPGDAEFSLSKTSFDCSDLGENTVILSYSGSGIDDSCEISVTVRDNLSPVVNLKGAQLDLDDMGNASLTSAYVNAGSTDNCSTNLNFSFSKTNFNCEDVGSNQVEVTVTDENGNSISSTTTVFVNPNPGVCDAQETSVEYVFLYPNPTKGEFSIAVPDDVTIYRLMIYDARGRFIKEVDFSGDASPYNLELLNVRDAVYFLRLYTSEGRKTERLIINN